MEQPMYSSISQFVTIPESKGRAGRAVGAAAATLMLLVASEASAAGWHIDCDRGDSLQAAFRHAGQGNASPLLRRPGAVVLVSGTCNENVEITEAFDGIVLDGQGIATLNGPDAARDTLRLIGVRNFTIRGFTITGGRDGINLRGAQMVSIQRNTIRAGRDGIQVHRGSFAMITDNSLQNGRDGIVVHENSAARVGFATSTAAEPSPNLIDSNGRHGILVSRASTARIAGNTITNNGTSGAGTGIRVDRVSQADIASNQIDQNREDGIRVIQNSGVNLGTAATGHFLDVVNTTVVPNVGVGIRGQVGGYGVGGLGSLNGIAGSKNFSDTSSIDRITP
jgi:nitrous oxidase accessory protein NosD